MEVSTKQAGAKRFDDPGITAALVGDADVDGPGGAREMVKCGKLEPKVKPQWSFVCRTTHAHGVCFRRPFGSAARRLLRIGRISRRLTKVPLAD